MIISASRRTDIPAFYTPWLLRRLAAGYVCVRNPVNPAQVRRVDLSVQAVDCLVFWSKDPGNLESSLGLLDSMGYNYVFQFTLTPYGKELEPGLRDKKDIIRTFRFVSEKTGPHRVIWRYDPIILNRELSERDHIRMFEALCGELGGHTETCIISFADAYPKLQKVITEGVIREIDPPEMRRIGAAFAEIASRFGIAVRACCEKTDLSDCGILPAACIDRGLLKRVCGHGIPARRDKNQRAGCNCAESVDIGQYNTCPHGCVYCYANRSAASAKKREAGHDPESEFLI